MLMLTRVQGKRSRRRIASGGIMENYLVTQGTAKASAFALLLYGWLAFTEVPLLYSYAAQQPADEEQALSGMPPVSIESDQPAAPATQEELKRKFRDVLKMRPSAPEERRLADGTLEITTQLGHFCAKPLPAQTQSGVGGNIRLAAPCANF
jgi:hypothetical protein